MIILLLSKKKCLKVGLVETCFRGALDVILIPNDVIKIYLGRPFFTIGWLGTLSRIEPISPRILATFSMHFWSPPVAIINALIAPFYNIFSVTWSGHNVKGETRKNKSYAKPH